jgi:hypothetical protein
MPISNDSIVAPELTKSAGGPSQNDYRFFVLAPRSPLDRSRLRALLRRGLSVGAFALALAPAACRDKGSPEYVADEFADAYFRRMDQEAALRFTALGATEMLDKELADTKALRESGYTPAQAAGAVSMSRGPALRRDARVGFHYDITVRTEDSPLLQQGADLELAQIGGGWKVVTVRMVK